MILMDLSWPFSVLSSAGMFCRSSASDDSHYDEFLIEPYNVIEDIPGNYLECVKILLPPAIWSFPPTIFFVSKIFLILFLRK